MKNIQIERVTRPQAGMIDLLGSGRFHGGSAYVLERKWHEHGVEFVSAVYPVPEEGYGWIFSTFSAYGANTPYEMLASIQDVLVRSVAYWRDST